jgi:hypothetical protein
VSKRSDAKKARRRKRQVARDARWIPADVMDALTEQTTTAAVLEAFDARITERGWVFDDQLSDDESALWFYPPSQADVPDEDLVSVTTVVLTADDAADVAHVVFVGTADDYQFDFDELFDNLDVVEGYRLGDSAPAFPEA